MYYNNLRIVPEQSSLVGPKIVIELYIIIIKVIKSIGITRNGC